MRTIPLTLLDSASQLVRRPTERILFDFDRDGVYETDVTQDVEFISDDHELQSESKSGRGKPSADTATIVLFNEHGHYSPHNSSSPHSGKVIPLVGVKVQAGFDGQYVDVFTGVVERWQVNRTSEMCQVECKDKTLFMQRKNAEDVLEVSVPIKDAIERLVNWTFGVGNQQMNVDNIPIVIPVLNLTSENKVWHYIQRMAEACDARAYFDGSGVFHFKSRMAVGYTEDIAPKYTFKADNIFGLSEDFGHTEVKNKWRVESEYLSVQPLDVVFGTPSQNEVTVTEDYVVTESDNGKKCVYFSVELGSMYIIPLRQYDSDTGLYSKSSNLPIKYDDLSHTWAVKIYNVTKQVEYTPYVVQDNLIYFDIPETPPDVGDILTVEYMYLQLVINRLESRTWYIDCNDPVYEPQWPEICANDDKGKSIPVSDVPNVDGKLCIEEFTQLNNSRFRLRLKNQYTKAANISTMQFKGHPIQANSPLIAISEDTNSQSVYGIQEANIANEYIYSEDYIQKLAAYMCDRYREPIAIVEAEVNGMPHLELGDRVTILEETTGLDFDFIIVSISDTWRNDWVSTLVLEQADNSTWEYQDGKATLINKPSNKSGYSSPVFAPAIPDRSTITHAIKVGYSGTATIELSWTGITDPQLKHYNIYYKTQNEADYRPLGSTVGNNPKFTHTGCKWGESYTYTLTSVSISGNESNVSEEYTAIAGDDKTPAPPTGLTAIGQQNAIQLSWNPVTTNVDDTTAYDIAGYNVYVYDGVAFNFLARVVDNQFVHSGLNNNVTKSYGVTCIDINGNESPKMFVSKPVVHEVITDANPTNLGNLYDDNINTTYTLEYALNGSAYIEHRFLTEHTFTHLSLYPIEFNGTLMRIIIGVLNADGVTWDWLYEGIVVEEDISNSTNQWYDIIFPAPVQAKTFRLRIEDAMEFSGGYATFAEMHYKSESQHVTATTKLLNLDEDTQVTGPVKVDKNSGGALQVNQGDSIFIAGTLFQRTDGTLVTSAEGRPITTDSEGTLSVKYPIGLSSAEGLRIYKGGLNVWSGTSTNPDLIVKGMVQSEAIANVSADKIEGKIPLDRMPRAVRTAPGIDDPTMYWGSVTVSANSTYTITFSTALPQSTIRVFLSISANFGVSNISTTGFKITNNNSSDYTLNWLAICGSTDAGSGTCSEGCEGDCQDDCQIDCMIGCESDCQTSCESICQSTCEDLCQSGCQISCQTDPMWI